MAVRWGGLMAARWGGLMAVRWGRLMAAHGGGGVDADGRGPPPLPLKRKGLTEILAERSVKVAKGGAPAASVPAARGGAAGTRGHKKACGVFHEATPRLAVFELAEAPRDDATA
mgnify:CR=1 FL=1